MCECSQIFFVNCNMRHVLNDGCGFLVADKCACLTMVNHFQNCF